MPFLFKLAHRVARLRSRALLLAAAATLGACEANDPSLSAPTHPSFLTSTGAPAGVSDLAAAAMTDSSATLTFTEVDDGTGAAASYDVRSVAGASITWGSSAPSVTRGTCATPVAGTTIGSKRSCTVLGLSPSATYSFQLVAYRGTLRVNAVFGPLSNTATSEGKRGTATVTVTAPPTTVTNPGTVTDLRVAGVADTGVTLAFTEVTNGSGGAAGYDIRSVAGNTLTWGSAAPSVSRGTCATPVAGAARGGPRAGPGGGPGGGAPDTLPPPGRPAALEKETGVRGLSHTASRG